MDEKKKKKRAKIIILSASICLVAIAAVVLWLIFGGNGGKDGGGGDKTKPPEVVAEPKSYVVKYDSNGGAAVKDGKYTIGKKFVMPVPGNGADPKMYGYSFVSWFYDTAGREKVTVPLDETKAVGGVFTLHAGWTNIHTVYFDTRTSEIIEPRQYAFGERIPVKDLPKATDRTVAGKPVPFAGWVNSGNGQEITTELRMEGTDMYLYASYDTGVNSRYEMLDDGTYKPLRTQAQTTYRNWKLADGQIFTVDMILPANPADYTPSGAGPVFAATGFNDESLTFVGNYYIWIQIARYGANPGLAGGVRFWGYSDSDTVGGAHQSLAFYHLDGPTLKGTPYEKKISAYLNGERTDMETRLTFTLRRAGDSWYIGIDGIEYFTFEPGQVITPAPTKPDEAGKPASGGYAGGSLVGFRSDVLNARFDNCSLKKASSVKKNPANRHTVTFNTQTSQKIDPREYYPGDLVKLPACPDRVVQGKTYKFLYWVDKSTSRPLRGDSFRMPTYDIEVFARYDTGTSANFELLDDGTYTPTKEPQAQTAYGNFRVNSGQMYSVDMILPRDPKDFGTSPTTGGAGPVFAATGFDDEKSTFNGSYYMWMQIVRSSASGGLGGTVRFWGYRQGHGPSEATTSVAFYKFNGATLKNSAYNKKMNAYLNGGVSDKDTVLHFSFRRDGDIWYIGIDGEEYFVFEPGKVFSPAPSKPDEGDTNVANSLYSDGSLVGFRSDIIGVRFANPTLETYDRSQYQRTVSFDTRTSEKIDSREYTIGTELKAADLPKPTKQFEAGGKKYAFKYWVDETTGKQVTDPFTVRKDMTLYAHYDTGTTPAFELQTDGTYKTKQFGPATNLWWSNYKDTKVADGQRFSVDMILPEDPADFTGGAGSGAGPVFAATGFNESGSTFVGSYYMWMQIIRSDAGDVAGSVRFWGFHEGEKAGSAHSGSNDIAYYKLKATLKGTPYEKKMTEYLSGKYKGEMKLTFTLRRDGDTWHIGIDGVEYFTFTPGAAMNPDPDENPGKKTSAEYSKGSLIGFRTNIEGVSFANPGLETLKESDFRTVTLDPRNGSPATTVKYPADTTVLLPKPALEQGGKRYTAACWIDDRGATVAEPFKVTENVTLYARYNSAVSPTFTVNDGKYTPTKASAQTTYSDFKVNSGQMFSVDMVMPDDPKNYGGGGPVFAATGFDGDKSTFKGNYYIFINVVREGASPKLRGGLQIFGCPDGKSLSDFTAAESVLLFYHLNDEGSFLPDTPYGEKMLAYLNGERKGQETIFTFTIRREGDIWYIGIDGEEYFAFEPGKAPAPSKQGNDEHNGNMNADYAGASLVGFRAERLPNADDCLTFANPVITDVDTSKYRSITFDTKTDETLETRTYPEGANIKPAVLPTPAQKLDGKYSFVCWVDKATGKQVTSPFDLTEDMNLYARYNGAKSPTFTVQDGKYTAKDNKAGINAYTTYSDWELQDGQMFSVDMILPGDPEKFESNAGIVFAATGFDGTKATFFDSKNYLVRMEMIRSNQKAQATATSRLGLQFWGWLDGHTVATTESGEQVAFYEGHADSFLASTAYGEKRAAYLNGEMKDSEEGVKFTVTVRRVGEAWHIGIDGEEYFTFEPGKAFVPSRRGHDTVSGNVSKEDYAGALRVGLAAKTKNVTFANPVITTFNPEDYRGTVTFETETGEKIDPLNDQPFGTEVTLPTPSQKLDGNKAFVCWVDKATGKQAVAPYVVTGDATLYARYNAAAAPSFTLQGDGTYKSNKTGNQVAQTTYSDWKLEDGQTFSVDMIMPDDPAKFTAGSGTGAGLILAATGFNGTGSTFGGSYYMWMQIIRSDAAGVAGSVRFWGFHENEAAGTGHSGANDIAYYKIGGATLKDTPYAEKMTAYLNGGKTTKETKFTFTFRREGDTWYIGIDGVEYFSFKPGEAMNPDSDENAGKKTSAEYSKGSIVGFRTNIQNVAFANPVIKNTEAAADEAGAAGEETAPAGEIDKAAPPSEKNIIERIIEFLAKILSLSRVNP